MSAAVAAPVSSVLPRSSSRSRSRRRSQSPPQQLSTSPICDPLAPHTGPTAFSTDLEPAIEESDDILANAGEVVRTSDDLAPYSASAQLRFLSHNRAANAELFWQLHTAARRRDSVSSVSSAKSSTVSTLCPYVEPGHALIYIHPVKPTDTLPSILLTYSIDAAALRQANRLWPHDTIQSRAVLLLPVDKCGIQMQFHLHAKAAAKSDQPGVPSAAELVGWAIVESVGEVEVCAVARNRLGFFPRRKSQAQASTHDAPRASIDSAVSTTSVSTTVTTGSGASTATSTASSSPNAFSLGGALKSVLKGWGSSSSSKSTWTAPQDFFEMVPDDD
ncbi:hypothetical protein POJ06DRAFT_246242 [Lipomyces tetrasporus]|uniref:LysM domain-containing protein n=1 Tax=Lipomyces tetrasporus TaxID=54092 RepID=A0AAD7VW45_9ASCO|nr:uncharacterized protein POJ06DRAFT_246242 [Lipomyces tetrasporus]KAJ8102985.1 hypothetical protein POJ06DRAFT_246242 [Lipomyces tetrasporus]